MMNKLRKLLVDWGLPAVFIGMLVTWVMSGSGAAIILALIALALIGLLSEPNRNTGRRS